MPRARVAAPVDKGIDPVLVQKLGGQKISQKYYERIVETYINLSVYNLYTFTSFSLSSSADFFVDICF